MLRVALIAVAASSATAFAPLSTLPSGLRLRAPLSFQKIRAGVIDDPAPEFRSKTKGTGFDAGEELRQKELARRAAAGQEVMGGGAAGSSKMEEGQTFAEYMASRAAASDGKVTDAMGNDITDVKPSYEVVDFMTYMYTEPEEQLKGAGALNSWEVDKSVTGFEKQSTDWLKEDVEVDSEAAQWAEEKKKQNEEAEAAAEAKMQMWLKAAAAKKAAEGQ
eukprot:CAMPEP_0173470948 /NCGR_PEP_ID=MMETSP1357-20121228/78145_1 /TAXON_ID=77926 /ORGANISM="Hemiselmis rufescens, Strain PCC563" /LENGTH=218 /DNA_ID=CAMNT_0014439247 /DNA_START=497 /DNA_END=1153 /DNA_ORIENTATION=-